MYTHIDAVLLFLVKSERFCDVFFQMDHYPVGFFWVWYI
jgi:hypothetical protein